ncbi:relaxase/mobilization nuclease domain-containing protein [Sulfitobacter sp. HI0054]|uniref:relaxase/mobilization nuclease domain-containing protein n=1 Tax=Sulfitobacter sp. HI0054 TaxID=1822238 RepID=UPI000AA5571D|nr:relaxase/mobilization nuclease domain-containing protein [Sulfitobacter sp. HI0054]
MILKGSQRGGAKQLGLHLLKTAENEHVEIHDVRGFMTDDVVGALREAEAVSKGTKCRQFLFSVSLNPPETESVRVETFEQAIAAIEERHGLSDQPRVVVFHEKEGRRHCHAVWSRIDAETMTAKPLPFFKNKLMEVSKQLYLEHGWQMPKGLANAKDRDPRNFSLAEWQQAKRIERHAGDLKSDIQEAWAISDSRKSFSHALEERGLFLARGDRRGHVAVTFEGEVISIPRAVGKPSKDITTRLGKPQELNSVSETRQRIAKDILPKLASHVAKASADANREKSGLEARRLEMQAQQQAERAKLDAGQKERADAEAAARSARLRKGLRGLLDRVTGKRAALEKQNQMEAIWSLQRDREQRHALVEAQMRDRQTLQDDIRAARRRHAAVLRELHHDRTNYRMMQQGLEPMAKRAFSPLKRVMDAAAKVELSAKPVADLGKKQVKALSRAFSMERPKRESVAPKPASPQRDKVPNKAPAQDTSKPILDRAPEPKLSARRVETEKPKSIEQRARRTETAKTSTADRTEKPNTATRSAKRAYTDSQNKVTAQRVETAQKRLEKLREQQQQRPSVQVRGTGRGNVSPKDRLQRLRDGQTQKPRGPELDR